MVQGADALYTFPIGHRVFQSKDLVTRSRHFSLSQIGFVVLGVTGFILLLVLLPILIGYGTAQFVALNAVPEYFLACLPAWSLIDWYTNDELFIPIDEVRRFLTIGCPDVEPSNIAQSEFISNRVFLFVQRNMDHLYFLGYRAGIDHVMGTILPAWNWAFKNHASVRKVFVFVLGLFAVGLLTALGRIFLRWPFSKDQK